MSPVPLAANAIRTLTIENLVIDAGSPHSGTSITLTARKPAPVKGVYTMKPSLRPDGPPERIPSSLPPAGNVHVTVCVQDILGSGRCGSVLDVDVHSVLDSVDSDGLGNTSRLGNTSSDSDSERGYPIHLAPELCLPDLVLKVADPDRMEDLAHEAAMYDEMESLQGVAIPRCYGWFEGVLQPSHRVITDADNSEDEAQDGLRINAHGKSRRVSVLLLEKMGDMLPVGERLPDRTDLWAIFSDLSQLGIEQQDMRYTNILYAPNVKPSLSNPRLNFPEKICPYHGRVHPYRAIDFDRARKTDWTLKQHYYEQVGTLGRLLEGIEMGVVLEPWEY